MNRSFKENADRISWRDAAGDQLMGQLIGLEIELQISEALILAEQGKGVRLGVTLAFKKMVEPVDCRAGGKEIARVPFHRVDRGRRSSREICFDEVRIRHKSLHAQPRPDQSMSGGSFLS